MDNVPATAACLETSQTTPKSQLQPEPDSTIKSQQSSSTVVPQSVNCDELNLPLKPSPLPLQIHNKQVQIYRGFVPQVPPIRTLLLKPGGVQNQHLMVLSGASPLYRFNKMGNPRNLEDNLLQVKQALAVGCNCVHKNCFYTLDPQIVFNHRVNIAALSESEQTMFLMGALMTCLMFTDKIRRKVFLKYTFKGRRVCKAAFLYLQYCSNKQLAEAEEHLIVHGVSPLHLCKENRLTQNMVSKVVYDQIKQFLRHYIESNTGEKNVDLNALQFFPVQTNLKDLHEAYKRYIERRIPPGYPLAYFRFTHFLADFFPRLIPAAFDLASGPERNSSPEYLLINQNVSSAQGSVPLERSAKDLYEEVAAAVSSIEY